ncbi:GIY-YIG nuclease family protein [Halopiger thermotolerans]
MNKTGIYNTDWLGLEWSPWLSLDRENGDLGTISTDPGLYRVRHQDRDGLEYIGETGRSTRGRVGSLARGVYAEEMPYRDPHTAAPCLWSIRDRYGPELEVSYAVPPAAEDKQERKAIEAALIALARREMGESPTANFGRIIDGYKQSSYSKHGIVGGPLPEGETEPNSAPGRGPVPWEKTENVIGPSWMGLEWSEPYPLADRLEPELPDNGVYRIWYQGDAPPLAYIGETSDFTGRLRRHEDTFGSDALFSVATVEGLEAKHKRTEIETDLIGAHYLTTDQSPQSQF